ncbi:hypothetical protein ONZ43_g287 [Nemania bipapillata]|uniref:Uncharacterized protein n=1 Tax=Nemania bipapillata TaxID=110536 RepID=A0ACC2J8Y3_9PEZI|nr:hypothetical protein ONZ43_g287 [Nemania bipapillata]
MSQNPVEGKRHFNGDITENATMQVKDYLLERVPSFRKLTELRKQGWQNPAGDEFFKKQRAQADNPNDAQARSFFEMMKKIARELHRCTDAFSVDTQDNVQPSILDWCMAPGGFLDAAMYHNRRGRYRAFSLPPESGGHKVLLPAIAKVTIDYLDLNLLASDMGVENIPPTHPEAANFLPRQFNSDDIFDLVICDGQVLRTHKRIERRENLEGARLTLVQLAVGIEHIRPGGKMLVLLHKIESWRCVYLLYVLSKFSTVKVFKPTQCHAKRSSCYLVASNIQPQHKDAVEAVRGWKLAWRTATFDTEEEYVRLIQPQQALVQEVLEGFGPKLIDLATNVWETQGAALAKASFIRKKSTSSPWLA